MKNEKLAWLGECILPAYSLLRIQLEFKLTQKEADLLQCLTYTDEGFVNLLLPVPVGAQKMKGQLGLIETGLFDYIIGCVIHKRNHGKLPPDDEEKVKHAHSMLKKFLGEEYYLISFEPQ